MSLIFLTQDQGMFLGPIAKFLGWILELLANFLNMFGVMNTGVTIILFTFLINTLMLPLTIKQYKFQKLQSTIAPEMARIQKKYKGKKDEVSLRKQQAETSALYQKYGTSPTSGCLPMLITLPILFALYRVIYNIPGYVDIFYNEYQPLAHQLIQIDGIGNMLDTWQKANQVTLVSHLQIPFSDWVNHNMSDVAIQNNMVSFLSQLKTVQWEKLAEYFTQYPDIVASIKETMQQTSHINTFLGLNIMDAPTATTFGLIVPVAAAGFQWIQTKMMPQTATDPDSPVASTMKTMNIVMPIMSGVFCLTFPVGVGLYWIAGSVYRIIQQLFVNSYMKKLDVEDIIKKNVEKQNKKRARLGQEPIKLEDITKSRLAALEPTVEEKTKVNTKKKEPSDYKRSDVSYKSGSIAANANLLKKKNGEKGDK